MYFRNRRRIQRAPNNAIEEGQQMAGLGELPEDLLKENTIRPPILSPRGRGRPSDDPFSVPLGPSAPPPATRSYNPQTLSTYSVDVPAGIATPLFAATRERSYSLIVNSGANDAALAYGRPATADTDGIPLAASGVGFHELINGTVSTAFVFSSAGTTIIVTEGRFDPPMES